MANLIFGGKKIGSDKLQFDVDRGILPEVANTSVQIGKSNGAKLQYGRYNPRVLAANFDCSALSQREFERELAPLLASDDVQDLIIDDRPDEVWHAKVDGTINLTRAYFLGNGVINFVCYDPFAYAIDTKSFTSTDGSPIAVTYNGTAPSNPVLTQTMTGDNGLVGWVNGDGAVLQFGDPESADGEELTKSDRALRWDFRAQPTGMTMNTGCVTQYVNNVNSKKPNLFTGTVVFGYDETGKKVPDGENTHQTYGTGAKVWHGPGMHGAITPNSNNDATSDFLMKCRFEFKPTSKAYGRMEWTLESGGKAIVSAIVRDSTKANTRKTLEYMVNGKSMKTVNMDAKKFAGGFMEVQIARKGAELTIKLSCIKSLKGDNVGATYGTYTTSTTIADFDTVAIDGITTCAWQYDTGAVDTMYWTDLKFDWVNVEYWNDIPNQFELGDEVAIDVGARKVYVNGVETALYTIGNQWKEFAITENCTLEPVTSSWATPATATVEVREAYL